MDKIGKKKSYILTSVSAALVVLIPIFWREIEILLIVVFTLTLLQIIRHISSRSILAILLKKDQLLKANSMIRIVRSSAAITAPTVAVFLIYLYGWWGFAIIFLIDSTTYLLDGFCMYKIPLDENLDNEEKDNNSAIEDIKLAIKHARSTKLIMFIFSILFIMTLTANSTNYYVLNFINAEFGTDLYFGFFVSAASIGAVAGSFISGLSFFEKRSYSFMFSFGFLSLGVWLFTLYLIPHPIIIIVLGFFLGVSSSLFGIGIDTGLQSACEDEYLGRIFSFVELIFNTGAILSALVFIALTSILDAKLPILLMGSLLLIQAFVLFANHISKNVNP
ncbi:MAG: MFS transporter [Candidatus Saliniplasma sp.]